MSFFQNKRMMLTCFTALGLGLTSCVSNDISSSENVDNTTEVKSQTEYFDFSTKQSVHVEVDFKSSTQPVDVVVYTENPYNEAGELNESIQPIFSAFTEKGIFNATFSVPSDASRLYISTLAVGYPLVLNEMTNDGIVAGLPIKNNQVQWSAPTEAELNAILPNANARTRSFFNSHIDIADNAMTLIDGSLYALYDRYYHTNSQTNYLTKNSQVDGLYSYLLDTDEITDGNTMGQMTSRLDKTLYSNGRKKDNTDYLQSADAVNLTVLDKTTTGKDVDYAQIDLVFLNAAGAYHNAMAYYYYPADKEMTAEDLHKLPKYLVFPRTTNGLPSVKLTARLQFFGSGYNQAGIDAFPPGYTIGWMLIPNVSFQGAETLAGVNGRLISTYENSYQHKYIYSNEIANVNGSSRTPYAGQPLPGCISLYDSRTQTFIIGFEDQAYKGDWGDKSFEDILFFAVSNPAEAFKPGPVVLKDDIVEPIWKTTTEVGTLAFEDMWPEQGDYDLNDMVVEYKSTVTYNQWNEVKEIVEEYKPVHDGAYYKNAFGVIINENMGTIDQEGSNYAVQEASNRFILWTDNNVALENEQTFTIRRTWEEGAYIDKNSRTRNVNPFLVINYEEGNHNRSEVHLPMSSPSPWADSSLNNSASDAYYVNRDGAYPFAIELYGVTDWLANTQERVRIDASTAYPNFKLWASSKGANNKDWYKK